MKTILLNGFSKSIPNHRQCSQSSRLLFNCSLSFSSVFSRLLLHLFLSLQTSSVLFLSQFSLSLFFFSYGSEWVCKYAKHLATRRMNKKSAEGKRNYLTSRYNMTLTLAYFIFISLIFHLPVCSLLLLFCPFLSVISPRELRLSLVAYISFIRRLTTAAP